MIELLGQIDMRQYSSEARNTSPGMQRNHLGASASMWLKDFEANSLHDLYFDA